MGKRVEFMKLSFNSISLESVNFCNRGYVVVKDIAAMVIGFLVFEKMRRSSHIILTQTSILLF